MLMIKKSLQLWFTPKSLFFDNNSINSIVFVTGGLTVDERVPYLAFAYKYYACWPHNQCTLSVNLFLFIQQIPLAHLSGFAGLIQSTACYLIFNIPYSFQDKIKSVGYYILGSYVKS